MINYEYCSHVKEQGSFANVNQEHQTWSDYVGGETDGRLRFCLCPGPISRGHSGSGQDLFKTRHLT